MLSAKILKEQGIEVTPVCFLSYFFGCGAAEKAAKQIGLKLRVVDFSKEHLKMLKSPRYGRGSAINPCIDCHLLMLKMAKKIMEKEGYDFIATGEVLGQRPFSQNKGALELIERKAGLKGLLVRPLSLQLLPETIPEKKGIIKRENFYSIKGKARNKQIELTKKFGIKEYASPAGGCILTDKNYSFNLVELFKRNPRASGEDCQLLRTGRIFWEKDLLVIVARNEKESNNLIEQGKKGDVVLEPINFSGPTVLVRKYKKSPREGMISLGTDFLVKYSKNVPEDFVVRPLPFPRP